MSVEGRSCRWPAAGDGVGLQHLVARHRRAQAPHEGPDPCSVRVRGFDECVCTLAAAGERSGWDACPRFGGSSLCSVPHRLRAAPWLFPAGGHGSLHCLCFLGLRAVAPDFLLTITYCKLSFPSNAAK